MSRPGGGSAQVGSHAPRRSVRATVTILDGGHSPRAREFENLRAGCNYQYDPRRSLGSYANQARPSFICSVPGWVNSQIRRSAGRKEHEWSVLPGFCWGFFSCCRQGWRTRPGTDDNRRGERGGLG